MCLEMSLGIASLQWTPEFQNSYIKQILSVQLLTRWETKSSYFLIHHLLRILKSLFVKSP